MGCTHLIEDEDIDLKDPRVGIVGVGGAGVNCVTRLTDLGFRSGDRFLINTDIRSLQGRSVDRTLLIGRYKLQGRGAGGDPRVAEEGALSSINEIRDMVWNKDIVFLVLGLGGGTGTGASHVVAEAVKESGGIVVPICTLPFRSEGKERTARAKAGLRRLYSVSNSVIVLDNNKLLKIEPCLPVYQAFSVMDQVIADTIMGILGTFQESAYINIDFSDVKRVLSNGQQATIIYGESASNCPEVVVKDALRSPFLEIDYAGAGGALIKITGGHNLTIRAVNAIEEGIVSQLSDDAVVKIGLEIREDFEDRVRVIGVLTNVHSEYIPEDDADLDIACSESVDDIFKDVSLRKA
jgi:cell division protein FtsZ